MSIDEIKRLEINERIAVVEEIWDSIAQDEKCVTLSEYEKSILDKRLASFEQNPHNLISWDTIKKKLHK